MLATASSRYVSSRAFDTSVTPWSAFNLELCIRRAVARGVPDSFRIKADARFVAARRVAAGRNFTRVLCSGYERLDPDLVGTSISCVASAIYFGL